MLKLHFYGVVLVYHNPSTQHKYAQCAFYSTRNSDGKGEAEESAKKENPPNPGYQLGAARAVDMTDGILATLKEYPSPSFYLHMYIVITYYTKGIDRCYGCVLYCTSRDKISEVGKAVMTDHEEIEGWRFGGIEDITPVSTAVYQALDLAFRDN